MGSPPVIPNGEGAMLLWTQIEKNNRRCVCGVRRTFRNSCYVHGGYEVYKQQKKGFFILWYIGKQGKTFLNHLNFRYTTSNCHLRWIPVTEQRQSAFLRAPGMSRTNTQRTTGTFHQPTRPCHFAFYDPRQ